jgi:hypothetical protein
MQIAEGRITFLQIVTSDFDSALWFIQNVQQKKVVVLLVSVVFVFW